MFGLFKKSELQKLEKKYDALMKESYELSHVNRAVSDKKAALAEEVMTQIVLLKEARS